MSINSEHLLIIPAKLPFFVKAPAKMSVFFLAVGRIRAVGVVPVLFQPPFSRGNFRSGRKKNLGQRWFFLRLRKIFLPLR